MREAEWGADEHRPAQICGAERSRLGGNGPQGGKTAGRRVLTEGNQENEGRPKTRIFLAEKCRQKNPRENE
jgi:hypothetical protein